MLEFLNKWNGMVTVNGKPLSDLPTDFSDGLNIILTPNKSATTDGVVGRESISDIRDTKQYRITVRQYMTKPATPEFDFMAKWNNNTPMPLRTMVGVIVKETKGMVYMDLHGDIIDKITPRCMKCGKPITNPVSQYFGMGPECGGHNYVSPFENEAELKEAVESYKAKLRDIKWSGWIIRSAIERMEEL